MEIVSIQESFSFGLAGTNFLAECGDICRHKCCWTISSRQFYNRCFFESWFQVVSGLLPQNFCRGEYSARQGPAFAAGLLVGLAVDLDVGCMMVTFLENYRALDSNAIKLAEWTYLVESGVGPSKAVGGGLFPVVQGCMSKACFNFGLDKNKPIRLSPPSELYKPFGDVSEVRNALSIISLMLRTLCSKLIMACCWLQELDITMLERLVCSKYLFLVFFCC